jgi:hypothetical protein
MADLQLPNLLPDRRLSIYFDLRLLTNVIPTPTFLSSTLNDIA